MLYLIEYIGSQIPEPRFFPTDEEMNACGDIIIADEFYSLVESDDEAALLETIGRYPALTVTEPGDGRYIGAGGDEVYVLNGRLVEAEELFEGLGLCPADFVGDAATWDDVDLCEVWDRIPAY